jgi:hypothetical protein
MKKAAGTDSGGLQIIAPHSGQSSQLFLDAKDGNGLFLRAVARKGLVK